MKRINSISLAVLSLISAAFVFSSCEKENFKGVDSKYVRFTVVTEAGIDTKAAGVETFETSEISTDGLTMYMGGSVRQNVEDVFSNEVVTKGSIITSVTNPVVTMDKPDGSFYARGTAAPAFGNEGDAYWCLYDVNTNEKVVWPEDGGTYNFWSYAGAASYTEATADNKIAYTGNAPADDMLDATNMMDFVVAHSGVAHKHSDPQNLVGLEFHHALSAVRFDFDIEGAEVTKVVVGNVKKDGVVTYNISDNENYTNVFTWDPEAASSRVSYSQTTFDTVDDCTFFFVPQTLSDIYVTFTFVKDSKEYQITAKGTKLGVSTWKPGCIYTYTVSNSYNGNVGIQVDENFSAQTKKEHVKVTNTKRSSAYVRARVVANWCTPGGRVLEPFTGIINYNTTDWALGSDGCYYSLQPVVGYQSSADLIGEFTNPTDATQSGRQLVMTIMAQAVECDEYATNDGRTSSVAQAWPGVTIGGQALTSVLLGY